MLDIQIKTDGMTDLLRSVLDLPGIFRRARKSSLKSLGWAVQQDIKATGRALMPKLNPHTGVLSVMHDQGGRRGRNVKWSKRRRNKKWITGTSRLHGKDGQVAQKYSTRLQPFSRFVGMIRYQTDSQDMIVEIGLLHPKPNYWQWMAKNTTGFSTSVTPKMRRMLFAAGFPISKNTRQLRTPSRKWMSVVYARWETKAITHFEKKFWENYHRYATNQKIKVQT